MNRFALSIAVPAALAFGAFAGAGVQQEEDKATVTALTRDLKAQSAVIHTQDLRIQKLESRLVAVETWFRALPTVATGLESGVQDADANGFTQAGANPRAREILLASLKQLASGLKTPLPAPDLK